MARRRRSRRLWIAVALVTAAALGGLAWWRGRAAPERAIQRSEPREEIGESDRRALRELLERKSPRGSE